MTQISLTIKLLLAAFIAAVINESTAFMVLHITNEPIYSILWLNLFGALIGYITNSYVYGIYTIVWGMFLRWIITTCLTLFLSVKLYKYLNTLEKVKEWRSKFTGLKLTAFNYSIILITTWIIFGLWIYVMTKNYVFVYRQGKTINNIDIALLILMIFIVGMDQYFAKLQSQSQSQSYSITPRIMNHKYQTKTIQ